MAETITNVSVGIVTGERTKINSATITNGRIYFSKDTGELFYDWNNERVQICPQTDPGNATLSIKANGTDVSTFTANSTVNRSIDISAGSNITINSSATTGKITISGTDTKNTAGATVTNSTVYLVGPTSTGSASATTYANASVYMSSGKLYSDKKVVATEEFVTGKGYQTAANVASAINTSINALSVSDSAQTGKYVSAVSESAGKITVTRADLPVTSVAGKTGAVDLDDLNIGTKPSSSGTATNAVVYDGNGSKGLYFSSAAASTTNVKFAIDSNGFVTGTVTDSGNTWRNVYTNGTSQVGTGTSTKAINYVGASGITVSYLAAGTGSDQSGNASYFNVSVGHTNSITASDVSATISGKTLTIPKISYDAQGHITAVTSGTVTTQDTDTKNTAGSSSSTGKLFLVGAGSQAESAVTYSNANVYTSGGKLYSNSKVVLNADDLTTINASIDRLDTSVNILNSSVAEALDKNLKILNLTFTSGYEPSTNNADSWVDLGSTKAVAAAKMGITETEYTQLLDGYYDIVTWYDASTYQVDMGGSTITVSKSYDNVQYIAYKNINLNSLESYQTVSTGVCYFVPCYEMVNEYSGSKYLTLSFLYDPYSGGAALPSYGYRYDNLHIPDALVPEEIIDCSYGDESLFSKVLSLNWSKDVVKDFVCRYENRIYHLIGLTSSGTTSATFVCLDGQLNNNGPQKTVYWVHAQSHPAVWTNGSYTLATQSDIPDLTNYVTTAQYNANMPNNFSGVYVWPTATSAANASISVSPDSSKDVLTFKAGTNVTLTGDATNDIVTINAVDTTYAAGDGININANNQISSATNIKVKVGDSSFLVPTGGSNPGILDISAGPNVTITPDVNAKRITVAASGFVQGDGISIIKAITQSAYEALATKDPSTVYIVTADLE